MSLTKEGIKSPKSSWVEELPEEQAVPMFKKGHEGKKVHCGKPLKFGGCLLILMEVQLMYNVILVSGALHSDLTYTCLMK